MTALEIILIIVLYISLGMWICQKREWYDHQCNNDGDKAVINIFAIILTPLNILVVFVKEFIIRGWRN